MDEGYKRLKVAREGRTTLLELDHGKANEMGSTELDELERLPSGDDSWERDRLEVQQRQHVESSRKRSSARPARHVVHSNNDGAG